jgi:hypothetical protein
MALPAVALGADALIRRWRRLAIPVAVVLLLGVPGNVHQLMNPKVYFANGLFTKPEILAVPKLPMADQLHGSRVLLPIQRLEPEGLTFGWLVDNAGKIPSPRLLYPIQTSTFVRSLFLVPSSVASPPKCVPVPRSSIRTLAQGQKLTFERGDASVAYLPLVGPRSAPQVNTVKPSTVEALVGPLRVIIKPETPGVLICE